MFRFKCTSCDEWHEGMPALGAQAPLYYYSVPDHERDKRCALESDICVVDRQFFFVRGCLEIPVHGHSEPLSYGLWVSLSKPSFDQFVACYDSAVRSHIGPFFGWLSAAVALYPDTENLKTRIHLRDNFDRPFIELEPTDHPLAVEQRNGVTVERVAEIFAHHMHSR